MNNNNGYIFPKFILSTRNTKDDHTREKPINTKNYIIQCSQILIF